MPDHNPGLQLLRRLNTLMSELAEVEATAGGWAHRIPAEAPAAWKARKRELLADVDRRGGLKR